ncbi:MAG: 6-carboxytetrahydropterin synthase [Actinomycetota bacterium]
MALYVTRRETFSAGHTLFNPQFSDERNREIFGKCSNPSGHGHNYVLEVTLRGEPDPNTGFLFDLSELAAIMRKQVIDDIDHRNLNTDVDWLAVVIPTTENLASAFWERLDSHLPDRLLYSIRLGETEKNWAERRRD